MLKPIHRVLVAVHGYEPSTWAARVLATLAMWSRAEIRVLAAPGIPAPPFTSLTPPARRAWAGARHAWRRQEEARVRRLTEALRPGLPAGSDVLCVPSMDGDPVRTIVRHADQWPADVLMVGAPMPTLGTWLWPGPIHQRLLRQAPCAVLVIPGPRLESRRRPTPRPRTLAWLRAAVAQRGA
jgi:nucleotide-binding universal stress UspA family protein